MYILSCHLCDHYKGDDHLMLTAWVYGPLVLVSLHPCTHVLHVSLACMHTPKHTHTHTHTTHTHTHTQFHELYLEDLCKLTCAARVVWWVSSFSIWGLVFQRLSYCDDVLAAIVYKYMQSFQVSKFHPNPKRCGLHQNHFPPPPLLQLLPRLRQGAWFMFTYTYM